MQDIIRPQTLDGSRGILAILQTEALSGPCPHGQSKIDYKNDVAGTTALSHLSFSSACLARPTGWRPGRTPLIWSTGRGWG